MPDLAALWQRVIATTLEFSGIRLRNLDRLDALSVDEPRSVDSGRAPTGWPPPDRRAGLG